MADKKPNTLEPVTVEDVIGALESAAADEASHWQARIAHLEHQLVNERRKRAIVTDKYAESRARNSALIERAEGLERVNAKLRQRLAQIAREYEDLQDFAAGQMGEVEQLRRSWGHLAKVAALQDHIAHIADPCRN